MPLLKLQTNLTIDQDKRAQLLKQLSQNVAEQLGKPERYVMISLEHNPDMLFAGSDQPLAYLELKSIGLPVSSCKELSNNFCGLLESLLGIKPDRIYIEFADAPRAQWGWNGGTF